MGSGCILATFSRSRKAICGSTTFTAILQGVLVRCTSLNAYAEKYMIECINSDVALSSILSSCALGIPGNATGPSD